MKEIGGFFELELNQRTEYHKNAIRLNTGRNAFEYILRAKKYKKAFLPFYTCEVMLEPIKKNDLEFEFYSIDESFMPIFDFKSLRVDEAFIYTNYFGICDNQVKEVANRCENLIVDNSQAFFSKPLPNVDTFYSARKFFGVPDGAYLYTNKLLNCELGKDISYKRCQHLLGRIDTGAESHFQTYKENDNNLCYQPILEMSNLTQRLLSSIDYNTVADLRRQNFTYFHSRLYEENKLKFEFDNSSVPLIYPFLSENGNTIKMNLINEKIFVATYWPNVLRTENSNCIETKLARNLVSIPIDQRNREIDNIRMIQIIKSTD